MSTTASPQVTLDDVRAARERIRAHVRHTPMLRKEVLTQRFGVPVHLKGEHMQRTGSFKIRGALNLISQLNDAERSRGVVAASAGNHAQGVAVAATMCGVAARIFMPEDATLSKIEATRGYGAVVELAGENLSMSLEAAREYADRTGAVFVHPFDDPRIIAGQGTIALEMLEDVPDIETLIVPIGGGGLYGGIATVMRELRPQCRLIGVQARACPSLHASLAAGHPVLVPSAPTLADGIAVKQPGGLSFEIIQHTIDQLVMLDDDDISRSMLWLIERAKQIVEGSGAASVAALHSGEIEVSGPTVCVLSGGNIDPMQLMPVIRYSLTTVGRFMTLRTTLPDRPGELSRMLALLAKLKVNILSVEHRREGMRMRVGETRIDMTLQTRNLDHVEEVRAALDADGYVVQVEER